VALLKKLFLPLNELGKTKLSYHQKAKNKKMSIFIYKRSEFSSKALGDSSRMEGFWMEVVLRAGGTFCQAKREVFSENATQEILSSLFFSTSEVSR